MEVDMKILDWLLAGDVSIQYQVQRDLLDHPMEPLRSRIEHEGWGARFLAKRHPEGYWGRGFYQVKWISSHYSLLDLKTLQFPPNNALIQQSIARIVERRISEDGGINPAGTIRESDVCVNGMFLSYACYFGVVEASIQSVVDFVLEQQMPDGGFNCRKNRAGAVHSSMHSTISVIEGMLEYERNGYKYRLGEMQAAGAAAWEFLLLHQLYLSDRTGEIISPQFLMLSFPARWYYDILRALDTYQDAGLEWDERLRPAMSVLYKKRRKDGRWPLQARHPGQTHFEMERPGQPSRWNTLRALRVLRKYSVAVD
jgi:hypothetical protein